MCPVWGTSLWVEYRDAGQGEWKYGVGLLVFSSCSFESV
jgi:hypothetical protein